MRITSKKFVYRLFWTSCAVCALALIEYKAGTQLTAVGQGSTPSLVADTNRFSPGSLEDTNALSALAFVDTNAVSAITFADTNALSGSIAEDTNSIALATQ